MTSLEILRPTQYRGAKVALTGYNDSLFYLTDGCQFVYTWPSDTIFPFHVVVDEESIPFAAVRLLREFKELLASQPEHLRVVGIAGWMRLDKLVKIHAYAQDPMSGSGVSMSGVSFIP